MHGGRTAESKGVNSERFYGVEEYDLLSQVEADTISTQKGIGCDETLLSMSLVDQFMHGLRTTLLNHDHPCKDEKEEAHGIHGEENPRLRQPGAIEEVHGGCHGSARRATNHHDLLTPDGPSPTCETDGDADEEVVYENRDYGCEENGREGVA